MKSNNLKKIFKASVLTILLSASFSTIAAPTDQVVAIVGKSAILKSDLDHGVAQAERQFKAQKQEVPPVNVLQTQVLNQLILRNAQLEQVKRYAIQADEKSLNEAVMKVAQQSGSGSLEAFQKKLDSAAPGTYESIRENIADDMLIQRLRQQQVMSRIKISDQDVDNFLKSPEGQAAVGGQVKVLHFRLAGNASTEELRQQGLALKAALANSSDMKSLEKQFSTGSIKVQAIDMGFRPLSDIPAELATRVATLDVGQSTDLIPAPDGIHILKLTDRKDNSKKALVGQYNTRHILIKTSEIVTPENAKQIIDSLYNRIQAGEDFATLAATYSNDPGSARDGGSLGWVSPGMMVPEFDKLMQSSEVGKVTQPFETQFGWHILQVTDTRQQDMTREYQRRMARQTLGERQFDAELDGWLRELRANTFVEIKDPTLKQ